MIVASRYAQALMDLAVEKNQLEEVRKDMRAVKGVCVSNHDFVTLLQSPIVKTDKKIAIIKSIFEGNISSISISFINLIINKRREANLEIIAEEFENHYKTNKNIVSVNVKTAVALDDTLKNQVLTLVKKSVTGEIELIQSIDSSLIGGFVLTINDKQIDQSVKRKLNDLRKNFARNELSIVTN
jgi:F-type H+-transporting ATPase subunit delta